MAEYQVKQQFRYDDETSTKPKVLRVFGMKEEAALYGTTVVMNWLTDHPEAKHVLKSTKETWLDVERGVAMDVWVVEKR